MIVETVKKNLKTTVTITSVVAVLGFYTALTQILDQRYALAEDAIQTQQMMTVYMRQEMEDKIFIIELKEQRNEATDVDMAMKERYKRRLAEIGH